MNAKTQNLSVSSKASKASRNTPVSNFNSYVAKVTDSKKAQALKEAHAKAQQKKGAEKVESKTVEFYVPTNDRAGVYLFAYTAAVMQFIKSLPVGQQATAARKLHGTTALSYHGKKGNIVIDGGKVSYKDNVLSCNPKTCIDTKRHGAFAYIGAFYSLITTGKLPEVKPEGFAWKALSCRKVSV